MKSPLIITYKEVSFSYVLVGYNLFNNEIVNDITHRYRLTPEGTLIIKNAIPKDMGVYGCLASNAAGTVKETSILTYIGKCLKKQHLINCSIISNKHNLIRILKINL